MEAAVLDSRARTLEDAVSPVRSEAPHNNHPVPAPHLETLERSLFDTREGRVRLGAGSLTVGTAFEIADLKK